MVRAPFDFLQLGVLTVSNVRPVNLHAIGIDLGKTVFTLWTEPVSSPNPEFSLGANRR